MSRPAAKRRHFHCTACGRTRTKGNCIVWTINRSEATIAFCSVACRDHYEFMVAFEDSRGHFLFRAPRGGAHRAIAVWLIQAGAFSEHVPNGVSEGA
jgi:hypothetical protein